MSQDVEPATPPTRAGRSLRELLAFSVWSFACIKLLFFDIDVYLFKRFAPGFTWVLEFKFFWLIALLCLGWIVLGTQRFLSTLRYVATYPAILGWRLLRGWPVLVAFAPVIYRSIDNLPATFALYTVGLLSALVVAISPNQGLVLLAMLGLAALLVVHLFRTFRNAYSASVMGQLSKYLREFKERIQKGQFDGGTVPNQRGTGAGVSAFEGRDPSTLYLLRACADVVVERLEQLV